MNVKTKIHNLLQPYYERIQNYLIELRDVRNVGVLVFVGVLMLISWSGVKVIQTNYALERQVQQMVRENEVHRLQNTNMKLQNQYFGTAQYREVTARQNYGLALPGETVLLVPPEVAAKYTVRSPSQQAQAQAQRSASLPSWRRNFTAWVDFFLHRPATP